MFNNNINNTRKVSASRPGLSTFRRFTSDGLMRNNLNNINDGNNNNNYYYRQIKKLQLYSEPVITPTTVIDQSVDLPPAYQSISSTENLLPTRQSTDQAEQDSGIDPQLRTVPTQPRFGPRRPLPRPPSKETYSLIDDSLTSTISSRPRFSRSSTSLVKLFTSITNSAFLPDPDAQRLKKPKPISKREQHRNNVQEVYAQLIHHSFRSKTLDSHPPISTQNRYKSQRISTHPTNQGSIDSFYHLDPNSFLKPQQINDRNHLYFT